MLNKVTKACIRFKNPIILRSKRTASGSSPFVSSQIQLTEKRLYKIGKLAESNFQRPIEYLKTFIKKKNNFSNVITKRNVHELTKRCYDFFIDIDFIVNKCE